MGLRAPIVKLHTLLLWGVANQAGASYTVRGDLYQGEGREQSTDCLAFLYARLILGTLYLIIPLQRSESSAEHGN